MALVRHAYGKGGVRVMRVYRDGPYNEVRELEVTTMLEGDFAASWTTGDNRQIIATDTIKNITYIVAHENLREPAELFGAALAHRFLERYAQVETVRISTRETSWRRASPGHAPHPHAFELDGNGEHTAEVVMTRVASVTTSGVAGHSFMKSTGSGWEGYVMDDYTTLQPTADRIAATAMDARWTWRDTPSDYPATNRTVLSAMLAVFANTYSKGIQDSLYRMGETALEAVSEIADISISCPNKHYLPVNLERFGVDAGNTVFVATDEPFGRIECTVAR